MKPSLVKLVDVILRKIEEHPAGAQVSESGIRSWLVRQGYNKREIDAALKLVRPCFEPDHRVVRHSPVSARILSALEEYKLTSEARDALVRLELYQLIDPQEREMILDRLNHFEGEVGLEEMDYLLSWVVCGGRDVESQQTILNVLERQADTLH
jgi:uncharacterized protein Smg (DUF494 family)